MFFYFNYIIKDKQKSLSKIILKIYKLCLEYEGMSE